MNTDKRGLIIYFSDGSKLHVEFPIQAANETAALLGLEEILKQRQIIVNVDGAVVIIPFDNIKYIQVYPSPANLPRHAILGASVHD